MIDYLSTDFDCTDIKIAIADRLRDERKALGYSQDKLAEKLGFSKPTILNWEKKEGKNRIPTLEQIHYLCSIYECDPGYLLCQYDTRFYKVSDIKKETGLTEDSVRILHELLISELEYLPSTTDLVQPLVLPLSTTDEEACINMLALINYFICHITSFNKLLIERKNLSILQRDFSLDPQKEILTICFNKLSTDSRLSSIISNPDGLLESAMLKEFVISFFKEQQSTKSNSDTLDYECELFLEKLNRYKKILSNEYIKRSDFELSDTFLDLTKSFFNDLPKIWSEYQEYMKPLRESYPSKPKSPRIIR